MAKSDEDIYLDTLHSFIVLYRYLRRYSRQVHDSGHSGRQIAALRYLAEREAATGGAVSMGELAGYLFINDSSTSELVSKLEKAGLVARSRSKQDNRVVVVDLTEGGRRLLDETEIGGVALLRERMKAFSTEDLKRARKVFRQLVEALDIPEDG